MAYLSCHIPDITYNAAMEEKLHQSHVRVQNLAKVMIANGTPREVVALVLVKVAEGLLPTPQRETTPR